MEIDDIFASKKANPANEKSNDSKSEAKAPKKGAKTKSTPSRPKPTNNQDDLFLDPKGASGSKTLFAVW